MNELDTAGAYTGVVQGLVWGPLRTTHTTYICYKQTKDEDISSFVQRNTLFYYRWLMSLFGCLPKKNVFAADVGKVN